MNQWGINRSWGNDLPAAGGGGGFPTVLREHDVPQPFFRDQLDAERSMFRRTPNAEYPDGYLGTIHSRRGDRLLDALKSRLNQRQYQRGVHKGERVDPQDYFWPDEFNPMSGLVAEANGMRQAPVMTLGEKMLAFEQVALPRGSNSLIEINPERVSQLRRLAPTWR